MLDFSFDINKPWLVLGNFNDVLNQSEKFGGRKISNSRTRLYVDAMNNCKLMDIGFVGPKFTWTNKRNHNTIYEKHDRGWANVEWLNAFCEYSLWHLPRITSDHYPILIKLVNPKRVEGLKTFCFEPMWILDDRYKNVVRDAWSSSNLALN